MELPRRKSPRIPGYDYAQEGYYFVTICTHDKKCIFGDGYVLNQIGKIAYEDLKTVGNHYSRLYIEKCVVMPNHIHAIVVIGCDGKEGTLPNLNIVIGQYKSGVSRKFHMFAPKRKVWQRSFHDHGIRSQEEYEKIWQDIDMNPQRWTDDCFFCE
ncbi:MAG: hypothetical protein J6A74_01390 [Oscillospiraceae bacterium]|nr:hypothetical protein [Oscillospiraceae bacterium]